MDDVMFQLCSPVALSVIGLASVILITGGTSGRVTSYLIHLPCSNSRNLRWVRNFNPSMRILTPAQTRWVLPQLSSPLIVRGTCLDALVASH